MTLLVILVTWNMTATKTFLIRQIFFNSSEFSPFIHHFAFAASNCPKTKGSIARLLLLLQQFNLLLKQQYHLIHSN